MTDPPAIVVVPAGAGAGLAPVACRACGEPAREAYAIREMMFGTREAFDYRRCAGCGSLTLVSIPEDLARHYPKAYYSNAARQDVDPGSPLDRAITRLAIGRRLFARRGAMSRFARTRIPAELEEVEALVRSAGLTSFNDPVLDVGCGAEPFRLVLLRRAGFRKLVGIEPFLDGDVRYRGVPVRRTTLEAFEGSARLIMFHHSLEHVPDPLGTLRRARVLLQPRGRILVRTPIADGGLWQRYGTDWVELDAPRHSVVFSQAGLERLAKRAGLEVLGMTWESGHWEFIASEQYRRDVAMFEPGSWFVSPQGAGFDAETVAGHRAEAKRLNAAGAAGRAAIWLGAAKNGT